MRKLILLLLLLGGCASQERIAEAQDELWHRAMAVQPAAMTAASEKDYQAMFKLGEQDRGVPAVADNGIPRRIERLTMREFTVKKMILAIEMRGEKGLKLLRQNAIGLSRVQDGVCYIWLVREGELFKQQDGRPLFFVTAKIERWTLRHEDRHCNDEDHDDDNVWK
jgi:hypothetical protein